MLGMFTNRRGFTLLALALIVGLLAFPAAGVAAVKAPVGTWAGPTGESETDYGVLSIADAAGGTQKAIFFEKETNPCGLKPGIMYATATLDGETVWLRGDFYCPNTGELVIGDLDVRSGLLLVTGRNAQIPFALGY